MQPTLETERLILRPFTLEDAEDVQRLAGHPDIAETALNIPHPYEDGMAEEWISGHRAALLEGSGVTFAIVRRRDGGLVGAIGLAVNARHNRAEMGYWIGVPHWNRGYCTEAARRVVRYGFQELGLHRIVARHFPRNPASGRVMQKLGMTHEGTLRQHVRKDDCYEDLEHYGLLAQKWHSSDR